MNHSPPPPICLSPAGWSYWYTKLDYGIFRKRLHKLVKLHGCKYLEGRAENAPKMPGGIGCRLTMAERCSLKAIGGDAKDRRGAGEEQVEEQAEPFMPHLAFSGSELEYRYPVCFAPADKHSDDPAVHLSDHTLQVGQRIAEGIRGTMRAEGRRRAER